MKISGRNDFAQLQIDYLPIPLSKKNIMKSFPQHLEELKTLMGNLGMQIPETMQGFSELHKAAISENQLSTKVKELVALSIGIAVRCDGCIAYHVHDALEAGATKQEIAETIGVAVMMGGGPAVVYGCQALEAIKQFEISKQAVPAI